MKYVSKLNNADALVLLLNDAESTDGDCLNTILNTDFFSPIKVHVDYMLQVGEKKLENTWPSH